MHLEQAIHQRWAASAALCELLPADRLTTGLARQTAVPYATLWRKPGRTLFRTNAGDALEEVPLEIHVWHDRFDAAQAVARHICALFDRSDFPLSDGAHAVQVRCDGESIAEHDDGVWQWTILLLVQVYLPAGYCL
jgi:hypothetical protein